MKILLCTPLGGKIGGISRWAEHILEYYTTYVNKEEVDIDFFRMNHKKGSYSGDSLLYRAMEGVKVYIPLLRGIKKKMAGTPYDIVHIVSSASISLIKDYFIIRQAQKYNIKTVVHFRFGRIPELIKTNNWEMRLLRKVIRAATKVIVIDKASYDALKSNGFYNVVLLPNPLTPVVKNIIAENNHIARNSNKIIFAGHVVRTKGVFELLTACMDLENIELKLIGFVYPEIKEELLRLAETNKFKGQLTISGEMAYQETIKEMLSAGIFVLPTYTEGFPNVILESMACGCPIIASSVGAIPEMLDMNGEKPAGLCIPPRDVEQLRLAILKMLTDRNFANECGKNAKERVNNLYDISIVWQHMLDIWKDVSATS